MEIKTFTLEEIEESGVIGLLNKQKPSECSALTPILNEHSKTAESSGKESSKVIFLLVAHICTIPINVDSPEQVFPVFVDSIRDENLDALRGVIEKITHADTQARIADILWERNRNHEMAKLAATAYIESSRHLEDPENWVIFSQRVVRALQLGGYLGHTSETFKLAEDNFLKILDKHIHFPSFLSSELMDAAIAHGIGDPEKYEAESEAIALEAEQSGNWNRARAYWTLNGQWNVIRKDFEKRDAATLKIAETYAMEAEIEADNGRYLVATSHLERAIHIHRAIGRDKERVEALLQTLSEWQKNSLEEMEGFSRSIDVSEQVKKVRSDFKSLPLRDALIRLATYISSPKVQKLREVIDQRIEDYPLSFMFDQSTVDSKGRVIARRHSLFSPEEDQRELSIRQAMYSDAKLGQHVDVISVIHPAREEIYLNNKVRERDILELVRHSPFVPPGHEEIVTKGLYTGLVGDFVTSSHILVAQFESSIRYLLNIKGIMTTHYKSDRTQVENDLGRLLYMVELIDILGEDIVFDLQGLLYEKTGSNLRNLVAHGLITHTGLFSSSSQYLWWSFLRLTVMSGALLGE